MRNKYFNVLPADCSSSRPSQLKKQSVVKLVTLRTDHVQEDLVDRSPQRLFEIGSVMLDTIAGDPPYSFSSRGNTRDLASLSVVTSTRRWNLANWRKVKTKSKHSQNNILRTCTLWWRFCYDMGMSIL